jgi:hypothetical protein
MLKKLVILTATFLVLGGMSLATAKSWVGTVSDSMCGAKHAKAGDEAATCVAKCVSGGNKYVLVSRGKVFQVDPQDKFSDFAGKSVKVTGTLSGESITAESVEAAPAHMKKAAKPSGQ